MEALEGFAAEYGSVFLWIASTVVVLGGVVLFMAMFLALAERRDRLKRFSRPPWIDNRVYRHIKSRRLYRLLYSNVYLEAEYPDTPMCLYQSLADGTLWTRPAREFFEPGRFREVGEYSLLLEDALRDPGKQPYDTPKLDDLSFRGMA
jgi:hypothetical protein